mgnify:FL=1
MLYSIRLISLNLKRSNFFKSLSLYFNDLLYLLRSQVFYFHIRINIRSCKMVYMTYRDHVTAYPSPANLSYAWNMGFLALVCLAVQLVTGIFLAMHYVPNTDMAFYSVEHILRDVWGG